MIKVKSIHVNNIGGGMNQKRWKEEIALLRERERERIRSVNVGVQEKKDKSQMATLI